MQGRKIWIAIIVITILIALRLTLPFLVKGYVKYVLAELPGYNARIEGVTINLLRGSYTINSLKIFKKGGSKEVPFMDAARVNLSLDWNALLQGELIGRIRLDSPTVTFIQSKKGSLDQTGQFVDWTRPFKRLLVLPVNHLSVNKGRFAFYDFSATPLVDLFLHDIDLEAYNLNNSEDTHDGLPARVLLRARSIGNGILSLSMKVNVRKKIPDLDMDIKIERVNMPELNSFFNAYSRADALTGNFSVYSEVAVHEGRINGYVKPFFDDLKLVTRYDKTSIDAEWGSVVSFLMQVCEVRQKNQFVAKVPIQGKISESNSSFWPALWNILRNAFVKAFDHRITHTKHSIHRNIHKNKKEIIPQANQRKRDSKSS